MAFDPNYGCPICHTVLVDRFFDEKKNRQTADCRCYTAVTHETLRVALEDIREELEDGETDVALSSVRHLEYLISEYGLEA